MQLILRHQAIRTWNKGSSKSPREKVEAGSRDTQDTVWVLTRYRNNSCNIYYKTVTREI